MAENVSVYNRVTTFRPPDGTSAQTTQQHWSILGINSGLMINTKHLRLFSFHQIKQRSNVIFSEQLKSGCSCFSECCDLIWWTWCMMSDIMTNWTWHWKLPQLHRQGGYCGSGGGGVIHRWINQLSLGRKGWTLRNVLRGKKGSKEDDVIF